MSGVNAPISIPAEAAANVLHTLWDALTEREKAQVQAILVAAAKRDAASKIWPESMKANLASERYAHEQQKAELADAERLAASKRDAASKVQLMRPWLPDYEGAKQAAEQAAEKLALADYEREKQRVFAMQTQGMTQAELKARLLQGQS